MFGSRSKSFLAIPVITFVFCLLQSAAAQTTAVLDRGLKGETFLTDTIDSVNLFNGNLSLRIPIGPTYHVGGNLNYQLTLSYNASVWEYKSELQNRGGTLIDTRKATPYAKSNAGLGWHLDFGKLYAPQPSDGLPGNWSYVASDGSEHIFSPTLHEGEPSVTGIWYTRDDTYLRLNTISATPTVEFPNGDIHTFNSSGTLTQIKDRFNNRIDVAVSSTIPVSWIVTDTCATCAGPTRQHTIYFDVANQIREVDLAAFGNQTATYNFVYDYNVFIPRDKLNTYEWPADQPTVPVQLLRRIDLPAAAGSYSFDYYRDLTDRWAISGAVRTATMPSGGGYLWRYTDYFYDASNPTCDPQSPSCNWNDGPASQSEGLYQKLIFNDARFIDGKEIGTFTYQQSPGGYSAGDVRAQQRMFVTSPTGDDTVYYFNVGYRAWDYSLPYTVFTSQGPATSPFYLSREYYQGKMADGHKLRSVYLRYDTDSTNIDDFKADRNRRLAGMRTVYEDDGKYADEIHTNYNGLGHYETTTTDGNFQNGNIRSATTHYTYGPAVTGYPQRPVFPNWNQPWIIETFTEQTVTENNVTARKQFCFDPNTAFLLRQRTLTSGTYVAANDIFIRYSPSGDGDAATEEYFGGDKQANAPLTDDICGASPAGAEYIIDNSFTNSILTTSKYRGANFFNVNQVVDLRSGLVATSFDSALVSTTYSYDALGRTTSITADGEAPTSYQYTTAQPATSDLTIDNAARFDVTQVGTTNSQSARVYFDRFGRVWREQKKMPDSTWSARETLYNSIGWKTSVSEYGDFTKTTRFSNFDPFGRAQTITRPDNDNFTTLAYSGVSQVTETKYIGTSYTPAAGTTETAVDKTESYDRQGRLISVKEFSGPANSSGTLTNYSYDIGNRLSRVDSSAPLPPSSAVNVALKGNGGQVTPSSNFGWGPVDQTIDGDRAARSWAQGMGGWIDATEGEYSQDWVRVDFKGPKVINEIDVYTLRDGYATKSGDPTAGETFNTLPNTGLGITSFDVQYLNGSRWVTVDCGQPASPCGRVYGNNKVWTRLAFAAPVQTSAIRVAVHGSVTQTSAAINYSRIVEVEAYGYSASGDQVWVEDSVPTSAVIGGDESWNWLNSNPVAVSGASAHQSNTASAAHQHYFYNAPATQTLSVGAGDRLYTYVYLDPANVPSEIMLQWYDGSWEHRAYWGANQISWGNDGTESRQKMGQLPTPGQWVRLEVPASAVNLEGHTLSGMAFTLFGGRATWDRAGKVATNATANIALGKTATQSTTAPALPWANASLAVDGNRDGNFGSKSVTHTDYQSQPWWQLDLGTSVNIDYVTLWNRTDCCNDRLSNFYVLVSDQPFTSTDLTTTRNQPGVTSYYSAGWAGPSFNVNVGRSGRYVRVQLAATNFLSLAEVEVFAGGNSNVARTGSARASTTYSPNYPATSVIDGDRTGRNFGNGGGWNDGTENEYSSDWLQVAFSGTKTINKIVVVTLQDDPANAVDPTTATLFSPTPDVGKGITAFEVQYWNGSRWTTVPNGNVVNNRNVLREFNFAPITTDRIRVAVHDSVRWFTRANDFSRIVEVEAWTPSVESPTPTQTRLFNYDNRGFLTSETMPEKGVSGNGTVTYSNYDSMGHVGEQVDGQNDLFFYYDAQGRPTDVKERRNFTYYRALKSFTYGNGTGTDKSLGKLQTATRYNWILNPFVDNPTDPVGVAIRETYTYSGVAGRLSTKLTEFNAKTPSSPLSPRFVQTFTYDNLGFLSSQTYPECANSTCVDSGMKKSRTVSAVYTNGWLTSVKNGLPNSTDVYSSLSYHPNRMIATIAHGNGVSDQIGRDTNFVPRPASISTVGARSVSGANADWTSGPYQYDNAGNITRIGQDWYVYDRVNRLIEGTALSVGAKQKYSYDAFGNMLSMDTYGSVSPSNPNGNLTNQLPMNYDNSTNRWSVLRYDASGSLIGNLRSDGSSQFSYDALNRMLTTPGMTYLYGPNDERMEIVNKGYDDDPAKPAPNPKPAIVETYTLRGLNNEILREYTITGGDAVGHWNWQRDYVYRGGALLAAENYLTGRQHFHLDHLGSARLITDNNRYVVETHQYFPFGNDATGQTPADNTHKFTGHERDLLNNGQQLYQMGARFYAQTNSRFLTVDPGKDFDPHMPQSWNMYAYVRNNPMNFSDPTGMVTEGANRLTPADANAASNLFQGWLTEQLMQEECDDELWVANQNVGAVNRAIGKMGILAQVEANTGVDAHLLAAIAIRETGMRNIDQSDGNGKGWFQIDTKDPKLTKLAHNFELAAIWVAEKLTANGAKLQQKNPVMSADKDVFNAALVRSYNAGFYQRTNSHRPLTFSKMWQGVGAINRGTTGNNYPNNVWAIARNCFW